MLEQYLYRAIIRHLDGDTERFNELVSKAMGIHKGIYGDGRRLHVPIREIIEAANGKPVIVYYNFLHDAERVKAHFKGVRTLDTEEDIKDWNAGMIQILLLHPASAGHGLNLQAGGNVIIWFGLNWSLELYQQANARLHRQGQTSKVICYQLITIRTIDEDVLSALRAKSDTQDALLGAIKARIAKIA